jgi:hypothetical protein
MHRQRHQRAAVALEPSRQFELEQNHVHGGRRAAGQANEIIDRHGCRPEQVHDARAFAAAGVDRRQRRRVGLRNRRFHRLAQDRAHDGDHVGSFRDEGRALLEQVVGALGARIERRAGHGEHFAALFEREPRGDQRARSPGRFHHHDADRKSRDEPVAAGEITGARLPAEPRR